MSVQYVALASQKATCPGVTAVAAAVTVAVRVTAVPEPTVVTAAPADVIARVVVVAGFAWAAAIFQEPGTVRARTTHNADKLLSFDMRLEVATEPIT
jgi:hypothetical protein